MRRVAPVLLCGLVLAGCGGSGSSSAPPTPPKLPHALAQAWAARADAIARTASSGDGCAARRLAESLRDDVIGAQGRVPARYRTILLASVNDLADRIDCVPPAVTVTVPAQHPHPEPKPPKHDHKGHK